MKKTLIYIICVLGTSLLASCFDDDSTLGTNDVSDIEVSGIQSSYKATAFVGEHLKISPEVTTGYSDMSYEWLLLNSKTGTITDDGDTIKPVIIGTNKDLDYEVATAPGNYQLRFVAKSLSNDYTSYTAASFTVSTNFSQGFYIMKETQDGNTELDLINNNNQLSEDLMTGVKGGPLKGAPRRMDINYNMYYVNPDNDEMEPTNGVTITTEDNDIIVSRSSDLQTIFDRSSLLFDDMPADEKPYGILLTEMRQQYYSSNGVRACDASSSMMASPNTGKFGMPINNICCSPYYVQDIGAYGGGVVWDEKDHSLYALGFRGDASALTYEDMTGDDVTQNQTDWDCLMAGFNFVNNEASCLFVLNNEQDGSRRLYTTTSTFAGVYLSGCHTFRAGSAMSTATAYSVNAVTAKYLYGVSGGKLYACLFDEDGLPETQLNPQGIGSDETISYVGNQFWSSVMGIGEDFNYLIVGTQKGNQYKLYFYKTVGGAPDGDPVMTFSGTGTVKSVKYLNPQFDTNDWEFSNLCYNQNN